MDVEDTTLHGLRPPDGTAGHLSLWNSLAFYGLRPELAPTRLQLDHHDGSGRLIGSLVGSLDGSTFVSGASAPMGGHDFARSYEPIGGVSDLVEATGSELVRRGVNRMEVRMKPPHASATEPSLAFELMARGFSVAEANLNFFIDLRSFDTVDDYVASLKKAPRKAVSKGRAQGVCADQLDPADEDGWAEAYDVLRENRESKGRPMRLPLDYVRSIRDAFPELVRMLAIRQGGTIIAAALIYRVGPGEDVVQYWGDAHHDLPQSPMNMLVAEVVRHALAGGAQFLDIGISTDAGVANQGLVQFKRAVGCQSELRLELHHDDLRSVFTGGGQ